MRQSYMTSFIAILKYILVSMDEYFKKLEKEGKNSVDDLLQWMKESKVIDNSAEAEEKARKLFADVKDKNKIELNKFKQVLQKIATSSHKSVEEITTRLSEQSFKIPGAFQSALKAFEKHMKD